MKISKPLLDAWIESVKTDIIVYENEIDGESEVVKKTIGEAAEEIKNEINQAFNEELCIESLKKFCGKDCQLLIKQLIEISKDVLKEDERDSYKKCLMCKMISIEYMKHLQRVKERLLDPSFYDGNRYIWAEAIWNKVNQEVDSLRAGVSMEEFLQNLNISDAEEYYVYRIILEEKYGGFIPSNLYQEITATNNELVLCYNFFATIERKIFSECMEIWENIIQKASRKDKSPIQGFYAKRAYWLCEKENKELVKSFQEQMNYQIKDMFKKKTVSKDLKSLLLLMGNIYATFALKMVFTNEELWRMYFSETVLTNAYRKTRMYNYYLKYKYDDLNPKNINWEIVEETSFCKLVSNKSCLDELKFLELIFRNNSENVYEYSYNCYAYFRAVNFLSKKLPAMIISESRLKENRLQYLRNTTYFDGLVNNIFSIDKDIITGQIFTSILKEVLFVLICTYDMPKEKWLKIKEHDETGILVVDSQNKKTESIWGLTTSKILNTTKRHTLRKNFSPEFEFNILSKPDVENLLSKGTCKNQQFSNLMKIVSSLQIGTTYFEQYITEMQTGVMISWKLFACTSALANCKESNKLIEAVSLIAKSVGAIHNLETRCWVVEEISRIMNVLINDPSRRIYPELMDIARAIERYAEKFNEVYDSIFKVLLNVFSESALDYLIYWQEKNEEYFSKIKNEVMELENARRNAYEKKTEYKPLTNPVMKDLYHALYIAQGNTKWYPWFHTIWLHLNNGQKWFWEEIELLRKK